MIASFTDASGMRSTIGAMPCAAANASIRLIVEGLPITLPVIFFCSSISGSNATSSLPEATPTTHAVPSRSSTRIHASHGSGACVVTSSRSTAACGNGPRASTSSLAPSSRASARLETSILSCVKTHFISTVTMSLKISLGLVHADDRKRPGNLQTHDTKVLYQQIAQINQALTPSLVIQDGYAAVISGGPTVNDKPAGAPAGWSGGITADPKIFIVSTDRIAADVAGIAVLQTLSPAYEAVNKTKPFANPQIRAAIAAGGLGIADAAAFDVAGPTVPNLEALKAKVTG